ncbi:MAG: CoA pyrophosphatase [Desulfobacteraceae bacterium]|nr:CoA pyrophosphatase [Desulfobacteraceae bacterium]
MNNPPACLNLIYDPSALQQRAIDRLANRCGLETLFREEDCGGDVRTSSVLLLLGDRVFEPNGMAEACIILNKRSKEVKQPGDLCCPGGAIEAGVDPYFAKLLSLPGSTLSRWPCWSRLKHESPGDAEFLSLLLAAGLREGWEEMRLYPFGIRFLGPLPAQCLILYRRVIHPMVAWVSRQKSYTLSWEVERIVYIPVRALLNPFHYAVFRLFVPPRLAWRFNGTTVDFPCFIHTHGGRAELLWGATYRIVTFFLEIVFGFKPPGPERLPLVPAGLDEGYVNGNHRSMGSGSGKH